MRKLALAFSIFVISSSFATAFEWGGRFYNSTALSGEALMRLKTKQSDNLNLWLKVPITNDNMNYFAGEMFYQFKFDGTNIASEAIGNTIDFNLLKFVTKIRLGNRQLLSINAGRFSLSDSTSMIFSQVCDGILVKYSNRKISAMAYGGYTGLLNANSVSIINKKNSNYRPSKNNVYALSAKYIPFGLNVTFPSLFANQTLSAQGWSFFDLNNDNYNRFYGIVSLEGYLTKNLFYKLNSVVGTVNFANISNLSALNMTAYFTKSFSMNFGGMYASGNQGKISQFQGFTSLTSTLALDEPQYSSMLKLDFEATKTFGKIAVINGGSAVVFDMNENGSAYNGFQVQLNAAYNIFNDLQIAASISQYLGNENNKTQIAFKAVVVF